MGSRPPVVFASLQLYTLTTHYMLYKKCGAFEVQSAKSIKGVLNLNAQESEGDLVNDKTTIGMEFEYTA